MIHSKAIYRGVGSLRAGLGGLTLGVLLVAASARADGFDPFRDDSWSSIRVATSTDPFDELPTTSAPAETTAIPTSPPTTIPIPIASAAYYPQQPEPLPQPMLNQPAVAPKLASVPQVGCGVPNEKLLGQLTIHIETPQGVLPTDHAAACWQQLNAASGPLAFARLWPQQCYTWDATCLAHRPLYFEEVNLERYGYGCCDCLQSAASAAHFFATVPALPYCMAADCPGECQYTLGHYRPGSCPPWRCHWPPYSTLGGLSQAGVLTGFIFLIP